MKRFAIFHGPLDAAVEQQIADLFKGRVAYVAYWHWIPGAWLLADLDDSHTVLWWREGIHEHMPALLFIVLETTANWGGFVNAESHPWMNTEWQGIPLATSTLPPRAPDAMPTALPNVTPILISDADARTVIAALASYITRQGASPRTDQMRELLKALSLGKRILIPAEQALVKDAVAP